MFAEYVKMGVRAGLIAVVTTAIIVLFSTVQIPGLDFTFFNRAISSGLALVYHWIPAGQTIVPIAVNLVNFNLAMILFQYAMIAVRWVFKVNE